MCGYFKFQPIFMKKEGLQDRSSTSDIDHEELIRTRLAQVEQGAPLIPHEEATRHFEDRSRGKKPSNPEEGA